MKKAIAVCCTYGRPHLLNEVVKCFIDQDYENKELIILNDQKEVNYVTDLKNISIINHPSRFASLGAKRNYLHELAKGDYIFIWDDDDLYLPWHMSSLINAFEIFAPADTDMVKNRFTYMSRNNKKYSVMEAKYGFFSGLCIKKSYSDRKQFNYNLNRGEDIEYITDAKIFLVKNIISSYIYRWGLDIYHISAFRGDQREIWTRCDEYVKSLNQIGIKKIEPNFIEDHWLKLLTEFKSIDMYIHAELNKSLSTHI